MSFELEFKVDAETSLRWAQEFKQFAEARAEDADDVRRAMFVSYLLYSMAEALAEQNDEEIAPLGKDLN